MPGGPWRLRVAVVLALVACHAALFYGIARTRATRSSGTGEGPMFGPVISRVWQPPRGSVLAARPPAPSEFAPVTEARADLPDAGAARRRPAAGPACCGNPEYAIREREFTLLTDRFETKRKGCATIVLSLLARSPACLCG